MPISSANLPSSTRTVKALSEVEAFALEAKDLKFFAHQFKRLQSKKLQHAFRYYSHQWRTWAACLIQSVWRRYKKRKMTKELALRNSIGYIQIPEREYYYSDDQADGDYEE
jgi:cyclic nucleotide gated channel